MRLAVFGHHMRCKWGLSLLKLLVGAFHVPVLLMGIFGHLAQSRMPHHQVKTTILRHKKTKAKHPEILILTTIQYLAINSQMQPTELRYHVILWAIATLLLPMPSNRLLDAFCGAQVLIWLPINLPDILVFLK